MHELNLLEDYHKGRNRNVPCVCGSGKKAKRCDCNVSGNAKKAVKDIVYSDVNTAVMEDAEDFAKQYSDDDINQMKDMIKDGYGKEQIEKVKQRVEQE